MSIFRKAYQYLQDLCTVWREEIIRLVKDEGVIIFFFLTPIGYPLLYSWIYNNEQIHEVPVVVVDMSHSSLSRQFIRLCDASPDVKIAYYAQDIDEAKSLVSRQLVKGIYHISPDFETNLNRMQQGVISVYCDMSLMLTYKAIFQTAQVVTMQMGSDMRTKLAGLYTARDEELSAHPITVVDVPMYNPAGGYGSGLLPAVLMLILQQTLVLGIGLSAGSAREENPHGSLIPVHNSHYQRTIPIVLGKALCYFMIYLVISAWLMLVVPRIFGFPHQASWQSLLVVMLPYLLACIFFGMLVSCLVRYRENVMLLMVFVSVPLLFLTGASWPQSNIPGFWQGISWLFPSTFGARAFIRLNSMGAEPTDVINEFRCLWGQTAIYFLMACAVYRFQFYQAKRAEKMEPQGSEA